MNFRDFCELANKVTNNKELLREDNLEKKLTKGTYSKEAYQTRVKVAMATIATIGRIVYLMLIKPSANRP